MFRYKLSIADFIENFEDLCRQRRMPIRHSDVRMTAYGSTRLRRPKRRLWGDRRRGRTGGLATLSVHPEEGSVGRRWAGWVEDRRYTLTERLVWHAYGI